MCCRLESYDRNQNFGKGDDIVGDDSDWKMDLPEMHTFRDVTSADCLPRISETDVVTYLQSHGTNIDATAKDLYNAR
jgi:hypothetical protein